MVIAFLKRLLSFGNKKERRRDRQRSLSGTTAFSSSSTPPNPQTENLYDEDVLFNRLLRSSSAHFSVISEGTEFRSMPPIPHPINNVLRDPSITSNTIQTETYTVKVHHRTLHSCTEFPNTIPSDDTPSSPYVFMSRGRSLPPLTPGDKSRLARLRQEGSVLSLLDIYDEKGNLDSGAFSNSPARSERHEPSLRALMGISALPYKPSREIRSEESDISWSDRYIRAASRDSFSSKSTTSSLGIPTNLFNTSLSPDCLRLQEYDSESAFSSREIEAVIDSLIVERGTAEEATTLPLADVLTSPARHASQFFKFLHDPKLHDPPSRKISAADQTYSHENENFEQNSPPTLRSSHDLGLVHKSTPLDPSQAKSNADKVRSLYTDLEILVVREGPKQTHTEVSPPPRRRSCPPLSMSQPQSPKPRNHEPSPSGLRAPFEELFNADRRRNVSGSATSRSVSVASSVHPEIESHNSGEVPDPYTPVPPRVKRGNGTFSENAPPNAPSRPVRGQTRPHISRNGVKPVRNKVEANRKYVSTRNVANNYGYPTPSFTESLGISKNRMFATPQKSRLRAQLPSPSRPSPASSSELSPQGRQMMANIRERARKARYHKAALS